MGSLTEIPEAVERRPELAQGQTQGRALGLVQLFMRSAEHGQTPSHRQKRQEMTRDTEPGVERDLADNLNRESRNCECNVSIKSKYGTQAGNLDRPFFTDTERGV
jgi:hypothetical protein